MFLKKVFNKSILLVQWVLVVLFIVFEELIWEGIAKPVYGYIHKLHILELLETKLKHVNRYVLLGVFLILLFGVELAGVVAGIMAVRGMVLTATLLYALKIPIAAFVFWMFRVSESKLMSFGWFKWGYEQVQRFFKWVKSLEIYQSAMEMVKKTKASMRTFKEKYLSGDNSISRRFRRLYRKVRSSLKKG